MPGRYVDANSAKPFPDADARSLGAAKAFGQKLENIAEIAVLARAIALCSQPASARNRGIVIAALSVAALIAGAGGFLAGILDVSGGILTITWKPQTY